MDLRDCDADAPTYMQNADGTYTCRCLVCARCGHHTGNACQGHFWSRCSVTGKLEDFHFCCPGDCELERKTT